MTHTINFWILIGGLLLTLGCGTTSPTFQRDYRHEMRRFVQDLSAYAKTQNPSFFIIPQNGHELLLNNPTDYFKAIDGVGQESLFFGYPQDDQPTPSESRDYLISLLNIAKSNQIRVLVTDYCQTPQNVDASYAQNAQNGYLSFAANRRDLDQIPPYPPQPSNKNNQDINSLTQAQNFLYLINPGAFETRQAFLEALQQTNYDLIFIDLFTGQNALTAEEVATLKQKKDGGRRLVVAYMSIGEAEDYRYYWQISWAMTPPEWLDAENPNWAGNYKVQYWNPDWQRIIFGHTNAYLDRILNAGFDGVYLDIIDAFEYYETTGE
jgi:cysteinyl-tRNA synthetase, unknown class